MKTEEELRDRLDTEMCRVSGVEFQPLMQLALDAIEACCERDKTIKELKGHIEGWRILKDSIDTELASASKDCLLAEQHIAERDRALEECRGRVERLTEALAGMLNVENKFELLQNKDGPFPHEEMEALHTNALRIARQALSESEDG